MVKTRPSVLVDGDLVENEWPFTIQLIPRHKLFADVKYQRPPQISFINKLVSTFDPTLVSILDVSARQDGMFAILDGLQRNEVLDRVSYSYVWCAVYEGMTLADEARFFYKRNRDRKSVHPYYQFNARVLMGEGKAQAIDRIVRAWSFRLHTSAGPDDYLAAIKAVEDVFGFPTEFRHECLSPTLQVIRGVIFGREKAKDGEMIRGLGRFFQAYSDDQINKNRLEYVLSNRGPLNIIGLARDKKASGGQGHSAGYEVARIIVDLYNRRYDGKKLSTKSLNPRLRR